MKKTIRNILLMPLNSRNNNNHIYIVGIVATSLLCTMECNFFLSWWGKYVKHWHGCRHNNWIIVINLFFANLWWARDILRLARTGSLYSFGRISLKIVKINKQINKSLQKAREIHAYIQNIFECNNSEIIVHVEIPNFQCFDDLFFAHVCD